MQFKSVVLLALATLATATPHPDLDKRAPTKAECCCCYGTPYVGCAVNQDCTGITSSICYDTRCPFK
ncbi:hypothetical protein C8034_v004551 [Colletotrichum sidae]|uniref:Uncharacterized protein n=2 Tax=Colletotrichum orbiculare species complex TaxID=2707354 RepID=A0A4R8PZA6_9PEZI|nr:hypothetical protein C8035_v001772 [Colletotrichum spinosum]TEA13328.1 hypothetical protein C8034_v004551 [Colletotrichum sidae]